jgi:hypothetical protein
LNYPGTPCGAGFSLEYALLPEVILLDDAEMTIKKVALSA